jgi:HK97 family phage major capsid protein
MDNLQQLRADREVAVNTVLRLRDVVAKENRDFNDTERAEWDKANKDVDGLAARIEVLERADKVGKMFSGQGDPAPVPGAEDRQPGERRKRPKGGELVRLEREAQSAWFARQCGRQLTRSQIEACKRLGVNPRSEEIHFRDLSVVTNTAGEHTIAEGFVRQLEKSMLAFGNVRGVADVMVTPGGEPLPWPTVSDHGNASELLAENTGAAEADPTFGVMTLSAYKLSSKLVQVPNELMQDSAFDIAKLLGELLGERLARTENTYFTTGTGSSQPQGVTVGASTGKTTASATAITFDEIIDLIHSVDPAYRADPSFGLMAHDNIWAAVRKLKASGTGEYLWQPSVQAGQPDRILNYPAHVNQQMASAITTGLKTMLAGAFKKFKIRQAGGVRLVRLNERYAEADQTAFLAFVRVDSRVLDAGTDPLKLLVQA